MSKILEEAMRVPAPDTGCTAADQGSGVYTMVYMATRTQIYLSDEQRARLAEKAKATGRPVSELVREAIDTMLASEDDLDATFGSAPGIATRVPSRDEWERRGTAAR